MSERKRKEEREEPLSTRDLVVGHATHTYTHRQVYIHVHTPRHPRAGRHAFDVTFVVFLFPSFLPRDRAGRPGGGYRIVRYYRFAFARHPLLEISRLLLSGATLGLTLLSYVPSSLQDNNRFAADSASVNVAIARRPRLYRMSFSFSLLLLLLVVVVVVAVGRPAG